VFYQMSSIASQVEGCHPGRSCQPDMSRVAIHVDVDSHVKV
jgi:hypothetical protein